jgi:hypothetical protein
VGQERGDPTGPELGRAALAVEPDEAPWPVDIRGLGADRVAAHAYRIAQALQQPPGRETTALAAEPGAAAEAARAVSGVRPGGGLTDGPKREQTPAEGKGGVAGVDDKREPMPRNLGGPYRRAHPPREGQKGAPARGWRGAGRGGEG